MIYTNDLYYVKQIKLIITSNLVHLCRQVTAGFIVTAEL